MNEELRDFVGGPSARNNYNQNNLSRVDDENSYNNSFRHSGLFNSDERD